MLSTISLDGILVASFTFLVSLEDEVSSLQGLRGSTQVNFSGGVRVTPFKVRPASDFSRLTYETRTP